MTNFEMRNAWLTPAILAEQATLKDASAVTQSLRQTALWLQSTGSTQWGDLIDGEDKHGTNHAIERGEVFIFRQQGQEELAGMVILFQNPSEWDINLWKGHNLTSSIFLHRLNINRNVAGKGFGEAIMNWVANDIRFPGKDTVRLDCIATNEHLFAFYTRMGYKHQGIHESGFHLFARALD